MNRPVKKVRQNRVKKLYITLLGADGFSIFFFFWIYTLKWLKISVIQFAVSLVFLVALGAILILLMRGEQNFFEEPTPNNQEIPPVETQATETADTASET